MNTMYFCLLNNVGVGLCSVHLDLFLIGSELKNEHPYLACKMTVDIYTCYFGVGLGSVHLDLSQDESSY
jgi:hypothetical protein